MTSSYSTDIVIFGGGIAGLWLLNRLRQDGYSAILFETDRLGSGQTLASQGIIHGGLKYALSGALTGASNVIADMPARWRRCLAGEGDIDLRSCRVLSEHYYMWSDSGVRSKLKTFLGSRSLVGRVAAVAKQDYPEFFNGAKSPGMLYQLPDFVVDTESLLDALAGSHRDHIFSVRPESYGFERNEQGQIANVVLDGDASEINIAAQRFIFCAGSGNQQLIDAAKLTRPKTQLRPLHMIYAKGDSLPPAFLHCIGDSFSLTPKLTITSHSDATGKTVWYLGGEIAEAGVGKSEDAQIAAAKTLLEELFPWIDFSDVEFHSFAIDRAEPKVDSNFRPDDAYFIAEDNALVAWPTKLTLSPRLADKISEHLTMSDVVAAAGSDGDPGQGLQAAQIANSRWD